MQAKAKTRRRKKVLFTPKDLMIFVLSFMYVTTFMSIDSLTKFMLFMVYTMISVMTIIIVKGV